MAGAFCLFFPSIIHRVSKSCWRVQETEEGEREKERGRKRGGLLMVWGIKAQNKVAEIHTHKPRRAGEATHCGLLVEERWFESLELREALGWVWSAPARAVFRISCLSIASRSPDCKVTQSHILIQFSGKHELLSGVTFIFFYPTAPECSLSSRVLWKACRTNISRLTGSSPLQILELESFIGTVPCIRWKYTTGRRCCATISSQSSCHLYLTVIYRLQSVDVISGVAHKSAPCTYVGPPF